MAVARRAAQGSRGARWPRTRARRSVRGEARRAREGRERGGGRAAQMAAEGGFVNVETLEEPAAGDRRAVSVAPRRVPSLGILGRSKSKLTFSAAASSASKVTAEEDSDEDDESVLAEMKPLRTGKKIKRRKTRTFLCIDCEVLFCTLFYVVLLTIMIGLMYLKLESHKSGNEAV